MLDPLCGTKLVDDVPSPDGDHRAVTVVRDCGATTDFSTQLAILERGEPIDTDPGNAWTADSNQGAAETSADGALAVEASWRDAKHLIVRYDRNSRIFRSERRVAGVDIRYQPRDTTAP